jgi:hypothetical protein
MTNVVEFPKRPQEGSAAPPASPAPRVAPSKSATTAKSGTDNVRKVLGGLFAFFMMMLALFWTPVSWLLSFDVLFKLILMVWHWDTPGSHAGWTFLLHFAVASALFSLMATFTPKKN